MLYGLLAPSPALLTACKLAKAIAAAGNSEASGACEQQGWCSQLTRYSSAGVTRSP